MWIVAGSVLQRYDGHRFLNFVPGSKTYSIPGGGIKNMKMD
jgi:hypothetical protein